MLLLLLLPLRIAGSKEAACRLRAGCLSEQASALLRLWCAS